MYVNKGSNMKFKKSLIVASTVGAIGLGVLAVSPVAFAKANPGQKFLHFEHRAERVNNRLDQAVKNGKITTEQKAAIETKLQELKQFRETLKDMTPQQRRDAMKQKMQELKDWAKANSIPVGLLMPLKAHKK